MQYRVSVLIREEEAANLTFVSVVQRLHVHLMD